MSQVFFDDLSIPRPDVYLGMGSDSHAEQTARVMLAFEPALKKRRSREARGEGAIHNSLFAIRHYR